MGIRFLVNGLAVGFMLWLAPVDPNWLTERPEGRWFLGLFLGWGLLEWTLLARQAGPAVQGQKTSRRVRWIDRGILVAFIGSLTVALRLWTGGPLPAGLGWISLGVYGAGLVLRGWAIATLGADFSQHAIGSGPLVQRGPYRWFRHPGYLGLILIWSGLLGRLHSAWGLAGVWGVLVPLLWVRSRHEHI